MRSFKEGKFCRDGVKSAPLGLTEHDSSWAQNSLSIFTAGFLHSDSGELSDVGFCSQLRQGGGRKSLIKQ